MKTFGIQPSRKHHFVFPLTDMFLIRHVLRVCLGLVLSGVIVLLMYSLAKQLSRWTDLIQ